MGHLFSREKKSKVTEQDKAVLQLKTTRDKIHQFQKRSESTIERDREIAKKLLKMDRKERAKLLLRKKHFIEEKLAQADIQLESVEKLIQDIEFAQIEMKVVDSLKVGNDALKVINEVLKVEDIESMLDETQEAMEKQEEISSLLSGIAADIDDTEVESELDAMLQEALEKQIPEVVEEEVELPDVPSEEPRAAREKEKPSQRKAVALEAS